MRLRYLQIIIFFIIVGCFGKAFAADEVLTWGDCIKEAAKNHPDLIAAGEEVKQSEASKQETASGLYPQIDGEVSASTAQSSSSAGQSTKADSYGYGVTGTQLIFDGLKTINNVKAAQQDIDAAKQGFRFTSTTVRYRLRSAFVDLLKAQEMLRITEEIFNIRRGNLELISLRYASGLEHKGALLTAEADLAGANYGIAQAKRAVEVAQGALVKEMGRSKLTPMLAKGNFKVKDSVLDKPDFELLIKNNASLQQIMAQKRSAEFSLKSAYGNFSPELSGQGGANKAGSHWAPRGNQWNLGLTLSMPIFEGGLRTAQVSGARALVKQLEENERSMRDGLILTLQQSWAALQDGLENVSVQDKMLIAAQERSKIAQAQYSIGFVSFDNWTIIEDNLVKAKRAYLDAQAAALLLEAKWVQAKG
ncbi:MAG: TolC family protein, partial [Candidatus Omnitrophica bacterium]|nr:TolC family protein [Candidatus Omnitrophota bacterium]